MSVVQLNKFMLVVGFGVALIALLLFSKVLSLAQPKMCKSKAFTNLINYGTMDRVLRIIQYTASGLTGNKESRRPSLYQHLRLSRFAPLDSFISLSFMMGYARKVLRFVRAPICLRSLILNRQHMKLNPFRATITQLSDWCLWYGDLADLIFYFTDHFHAFYLVGFVASHDLCDHLELLGHVMWILNAAFLFLGFAIVVVLNTSRKEITMTEGEQEKKIKNGILEMLSNFFQVILGFCFIYPKFLPREMISAMVLISSVARLCKLRYK